jgi:hypothetical protein
MAPVRKLHAALAAVLVVPSLAARADPNDYVLTPTVTQGERELDFKFGVGSRGPRIDLARAAGLGFGYGVTDIWFTELTVQYVREGGTGTRVDGLEWENILQLSQPGEWPVDVGMVAEAEKMHDSGEGWNFRIGPLLQKDFGKVQANLNLLLRHRYGGETSQRMRVDYQVQAKYRYCEPFELGIQGFAELRPWQGWASSERQYFRLGPAVFGAVPLGNARGLVYNAAVLFGVAGKSYDRTLRLQIEYEF